jgi:hypothetical protein
MNKKRILVLQKINKIEMPMIKEKISIILNFLLILVAFQEMCCQLNLIIYLITHQASLIEPKNIIKIFKKNESKYRFCVINEIVMMFNLLLIPINCK